MKTLLTSICICFFAVSGWFFTQFYDGDYESVPIVIRVADPECKRLANQVKIEAELIKKTNAKTKLEILKATQYKTQITQNND